MRSFFQDKLHVDNRSPAATFHLPSFLGEREYGILLPKTTFMVQTSILLCGEVILCAIFAAAVYKLIVLPKRQNSSFPSGIYLIGFGLIIPIASSMPFFVMDELDIRNKFLRSALVSPSINVIFRCLEAMFGFTPQAASASLKNYCLYYASLTEPRFNPSTLQPIESTREDVSNSIKDVFINYVGVSVILSLLAPYNFELYNTAVKSHTMDHGITDLLDFGHMVNNFLAVFLIFTNLEFNSCCVSLMANTVLGIQVMKIMQVSAIWESTSPSDFWSKGWNLVVHNEIKRGIYLPVRRYFPKTVSAMATFLASGLMHEYMNVVLFYIHDSEKGVNGACHNNNQIDSIDPNNYYHNCFRPIYGKNMIFFSWCGCILLIEVLYGGDEKCKLFQWIKSRIPRALIAFFLMMTALPMSHLLSGDWVAGGLFTHMSLGFLRIVQLETK